MMAINLAGLGLSQSQSSVIGMVVLSSLPIIKPTVLSCPLVQDCKNTGGPQEK